MECSIMCLTSPPPPPNKIFVAKKIGLSDVRTICNEAPSDLFMITLLSSQSLREGFKKKVKSMEGEGVPPIHQNNEFYQQK